MDLAEEVISTYWLIAYQEQFYKATFFDLRIIIFRDL